VDVAVGRDFYTTRSSRTSAEPCATCAGATYWAGIGRVVYGQSEKALKEQTGAHPRFALRPRFAAGQRPTEGLGPLRTKPIGCRLILKGEGIVDFPGRRFRVWSARAPQKKID
jgi:hypothetical protein